MSRMICAAHFQSGHLNHSDLAPQNWAKLKVVILACPTELNKLNVKT